MYLSRAKYGTSPSLRTWKIAVMCCETGNFITVNQKRKDEREEERKGGRKKQKGREKEKGKKREDGRKEGRKEERKINKYEIYLNRFS